MSTLTIQLSDTQHERLKALAEAQGISLNRLFEAFSTQALAEFAETRFRLRAAKGNKVRGLEVLERLDRHFGAEGAK